jgi:hypothetical protein
MESREFQPAIITNNIKILMTFIDRVGFPVLAFLLMWWQNHLMVQTIEKLNTTLTVQTELIRELKERIK